MKVVVSFRNSRVTRLEDATKPAWKKSGGFSLFTTSKAAYTTSRETTLFPIFLLSTITDMASDKFKNDIYRDHAYDWSERFLNQMGETS
jgi:hypothetical protein